jgi:hypothetical protein
MARKYYTLKEIEKVIVHDTYLKKEAARRVQAFAFLPEAAAAAAAIGGEVLERPEIRCDWMIRKEIFPGVEIYFLYSRPDEEIPASLQVLFAGEEVLGVSGEDLAVLAVALINQMIRAVRKAAPDQTLPEICYLV